VGASPGPGPSILKKRKQLVQDIFDDNTPLTDEECEPEEVLVPAVQKKSRQVLSKKVPAKAKAGCTEACETRYAIVSINASADYWY
jgi:hypothetical protein